MKNKKGIDFVKYLKKRGELNKKIEDLKEQSKRGTAKNERKRI
jgi:hypothetical protein